MRLVYRPLPAVWPSGVRTASHLRRSAPFRLGYSATIKLLDRELRMIGSKDPVVIEAGFRDDEIRMDGLPRANARPVDPAIVVSFESQFGPLRYGCDAFTWYEANLRAIALALEALRKVDRYGVTKRGEQYQGWKALPESTMTAADAKAFLDTFGGETAAIKATHPDNGGSREEFEKVQIARRALGAKR
jgi:hypothetical protein